LALRCCKKCSASSTESCPEHSGGGAPRAENGRGNVVPTSAGEDRSAISARSETAVFRDPAMARAGASLRSMLGRQPLSPPAPARSGAQSALGQRLLSSAIRQWLVLMAARSYGCTSHRRVGYGPLSQTGAPRLLSDLRGTRPRAFGDPNIANRRTRTAASKNDPLSRPRAVR
jgi:hypothetical protein